MAETLGKRADLTVIGISVSPPGHWSRGGEALDEAGWTASLVAHVTAGTNTETELATFIAQAHSLIAETFDRPATAPIYVIVDEIPATSWGYDGRSQHARRTAPSPDGR
jgi:4-oxalocrotonate tautomerase